MPAPTDVKIAAAATPPPDPTKIPHYFGPYPNWANSPQVLANAVVTLSDPPVAVGNTTAEASATVDAKTGAVTAITVTKPGSGYLAPPTVTIDAPGVTPITPATATAIISQGVVSSIAVSETGFGFITPTVTIAPAPGQLGSGATARPSGGVDNAIVIDGGVYEVQPIVEFGLPDLPSGTQATGTATMVSLDPTALPPTFTINGVTVVDPGSGYTTPPTVTIFDGTLTQVAPTPAAVNATINITQIDVTSGGVGYTADPIVTITDATNPDPVNPDKGASALATVTAGGSVTSITIGNPGAGYLTPGIKKFVDTLAGLGPSTANNLGQYIPVAVPDTTTYPGTDYYEIALVQYRQRFSSSLPAEGTLLRGYVQISTSVVPGAHVQLTNANLDPAVTPAPITGYFGVDNPHYLGPTIVSTKDRPVRILFRNLLPTDDTGNLFLPVDTTLMGSGMGPNAVMLDPVTHVPMPMATDNGTVYDEIRNPACGEVPKPTDCFSENRATLHLHGGITPWISDGTPHQWITPAGESTDYPEGVSVSNVPDMPDPGPGAQTFFYTNQQSARLMFYHDHAWGITRLNVYAGEAAGYLVTDPTEQKLFGTIAGVNGPFADLGLGTPLIVQDKTFVPSPAKMAMLDPTWNYTRWGGEGNLWTPHVYMPAQNPGDPSGMSSFGRWMYGPWFWPPAKDVVHPPIANPYYDATCDPNVGQTNPVFPAIVGDPCEPQLIPSTPNVSVGMEAFNDTPLVNGTAYPTTTVDPKAYRYRILNAANDRFWNLSWYVADPRTGTLSEVALKQTELDAAQNDPVVFPTPDTTWSPKGPNWIQIGTEGGFLPAPVVVPAHETTWITDPTRFDVGNVDQHSLLLAPAERADVIVDFSQFRGKTLILYNDAPAAFPARVPGYDYYTGGPDLSPSGAPTTLPGYGPNTRTIMQVKVSTAAPAIAFDRPNTTVDRMGTLVAAFAHHADGSGVFESGSDPIIVGQAAYNSAYKAANDPTSFVASGWCNSPTALPTAKCDGYARIQEQSFGVAPFEFKFDTLNGTQLKLPFQPKGMHDEMNSANFDEWGRMTANIGLEAPGATPLLQNIVLFPYVNPPTEKILDSTGLPSSLHVTPISSAADGTQIWKITHNGVDTHPIHFHLYNVQILNRVTWDNIIIPPEPTELGWKDTVRVSPLEDTIVALRPIVPTVPFAVPDSIRPLNPSMPIGAMGDAAGPNGTEAGFNNTDNNGNPIAAIANVNYNFRWEYVFHCHILSHEEMDMMRPMDVVVPWIAPAAPSGLTFTPGSVILNWVDGTPVNYANPATWANPAPGGGGSNPAAEIGFRIERTLDTNGVAGEPGTAVWTKVADVPANKTTYTDPARSNLSYDYRVTAWNQGALQANGTYLGGTASSNAVLVPGIEPTTTVLTTSGTPSTAGQSVTFTATVSPTITAGPPTGTVQFLDNAVSLGAPSPLAGGIATFTTSALGVGSHPITAVYSSDAVYASSISNQVTQVVNQGSSSTVVTSDLNPSTAGALVNLTATVAAQAPAAGVPTGTVQFKDNGANLGAPITLVGGIATLPISTLALGHHPITAVYSGNAQFTTSTSPVLDQLVNKGTTVTSVASDRTPSSVYGSLVTFTATVAVVAPAVGPPTGTVEFFDNGVSLGAPSPLAGGIATFSTGALSTGSHPITAVYSGDASLSTSTGSMTQVVVQGTTATVLTSNANPSLYGTAVTFTATVSTVTGTGIPTGTVQFFDGAASLGTGSMAGGVATLTTSALVSGSHSITAAYSGDANFSGSLAAALMQVVNPGATSIAVSSSGPSVYGGPVTFTATVAVVPPAAGVPTGTVQFRDGITLIGTGPVVGGTTATLTISTLGAGSHSITAVYPGDVNFGASTSAAITQVVSQGTTSTTITATPNPSLVGGSVAFTATVSAVTGSGARTGSVQFLEGATVIGTSTVVGGVATFNIATLAFGSHTITAVYSGDANFTGSTSTAIVQTVLRPTTTVVTSNRQPSTFGQTVTFTATVRSGVTIPSGTVQFYVDGSPVGGLRALSGQGRATFSTNTLSTGTHLVHAVYGGDALTFFAGSSSAAITQTVTIANSTTTVTSSVNPSLLGQNVTFTARVSPSTATGTVQFAIDGTPWSGGPLPLGATGRASLTLNNLAVGTHTITASYSGSADYRPSAGSVAQMVKWNSRTVLASSGTPAAVGANVTFTATVSPVAPGVGVPTGTVQFRVNGVNFGAPVTLNGSGRATITINTLPIGTSRVSARYSGDTLFLNTTSNNINQVIQ